MFGGQSSEGLLSFTFMELSNMVFKHGYQIANKSIKLERGWKNLDRN